MALNINGTTGISGVDGSASAASIAGTDANTGLSFASDTVNINTGGSTRMTVDSAGAVGIGTTTPTSSFSNADDLVVGDGSGHRGITILAGTSSISGIEFSDGTGSDAAKTAGGLRYDHSVNYMRFNTNDGSERMRVTSGGALCVNRASEPLLADVRFMAQNDTGNVGYFYHGGTGNNYTLLLRNDRGSGSTQATQIIFLTGGNTFVGDIRSTGSSTAYNTSSDYRLKENVTPISDGITRLKTLKPSRFNFKVDKDTTVDGFLAHEVTAVPEAVSGTKDEVALEDNEKTGVKKGDPIYQGIDQAKLVPLLTAALQEAVAKIEVLETKVAALEAG